MEQILHPADTRGHADHGWLKSFHSFSFAGYHNPDRINFGALRVLNDDQVAAGMGFGRHSHDNMEIISIALDGSLKHQDSMGTSAIIKTGEVQVMSAGTGVQHSEMNASQTQPVSFLQIWIFPDQKNVTPRYDQKNFSTELAKGGLVNVVAPMGSNTAGVQIHQNAWLDMGRLNAGDHYDHKLHDPSNGLYIFVLEGAGSINGSVLGRRDGLGLTEGNHIQIAPETEMNLLLIEVPLL